jgi:hypothetical protein
VSGAADGAEFWLAASTVVWGSKVTCNGKTVTIVGAGKGTTVLDAGWPARAAANRSPIAWPGGSYPFFSLSSGCTLVLRSLSMQNGKSDFYGGAISMYDGSTLDARDVEFKGNSAYYVRHTRPAMQPRRSRPHAAAAAAAAHNARSHSPAALACDRAQFRPALLT